MTPYPYKKASGVTDRTVLRDFEELVAKGVLEKVGVTGRATHYVIKRETRQTGVNMTKYSNPEILEQLVPEFIGSRQFLQQTVVRGAA